MKLISISDVHHTIGQKKTEDLLKRFCKFGIENKVHKVLFLGDIFDFLVGKSEGNRRILSEFKSWVLPLIQSGTEIHYFAGNHDFHLGKSIQETFGNLPIQYHKRGIEFHMDDKKFYISHGDNEEIDNLNYLIFKSFINNSFMERFSELESSSFMVDAIGTYMLKKSVAKPSRYDISNPEVKEKFRKTAEKIHRQNDADFILLGHSHVSDLYINDKFTYVNNGFVPKTRSFVFYHDGEIKLNHFDP